MFSESLADAFERIDLDVVLQFFKFADKCRGDQVGTGGKNLSALNERWPELFQCKSDFFWILLFHEVADKIVSAHDSDDFKHAVALILAGYFFDF